MLMKTLAHLFVAALLCIEVHAQAPTGLAHEMIVNNATGTLVANRTVGIRVSILQGSASGTEVYKETHTPTTNVNGVARIVIGGGTVVSGTFSAINWASGPYYVKKEIDITGGGTYTQNSTEQMLSTVYALHAKTAANAVGGGFTHYIGEYYGGGVVFHVWKDSLGAEHGLIVTTTDQGTSAWSNVTSTAIGDSAQRTQNGARNSIAIIGQSGHTASAAKVCLDLTNAGQSDWYLPSIDEFSLLWHNRYNVNRELASISGAHLITAEKLYWSSTERDFETANFFFCGLRNCGLFPEGFRDLCASHPFVLSGVDSALCGIIFSKELLSNISF